jgi:broad specificity phosphatase PhoE
MKIYILRHEERTIDATFFSPLTKVGMINANNLILILEKLKITKIVCSPYIRTIQTIFPFSKKKNIKLNLEYGLCEILHPTIIPPKSFNVELPEYLCENYNYNPKYLSIIKSTDLIYPEDEKKFKDRTKKIFKNLINRYHKTDETILIVTHQGMCKNILSIINNKNEIKIPDEELNNYGTGKITLIFNDLNWIYEKIN